MWNNIHWYHPRLGQRNPDARTWGYASLPEGVPDHPTPEIIDRNGVTLQGVAPTAKRDHGTWRVHGRSDDTIKVSGRDNG